MHQRVLSTVGRLDVLQASGQLDALMRSGLRFCQKLAVIDAHAAGQTEPVQVQRVGPDLVFGRLWEKLQLDKILQRTLQGRRYVVCLNEEQRRKDAADRQAIVEHLREQLKRGDKDLIGNKGYRKYLRVTRGEHFTVDEEKSQRPPAKPEA